MGVIMHKGVAYGGGSNVEANPAGSATDDLSKLGIDSTIYDIVDSDAVHSADVGVADGVAGLDANGKVPTAQLPTYPTVNDGTLTIQKNGSTVATFTANQSGNATANISVPTQPSDINAAAESDIESTKSTSGNPITITDAAPINAESLVVELEPQQDLHGYDYPWVGGAGKNKVAYPYNTAVSGTWNSMSISENDGLISVQGTQSGVGLFIFAEIPVKANTKYTLSTNFVYDDSTASGTSTRMALTVYDITHTALLANINSGNASFTPSADCTARVYLNPSSGGNNRFFKFTVRPQIEIGETASTWTPYTNICPISGYDSVSVDDVGFNLISEIIDDKYINHSTGAASSASGFHCTGYIKLYANTTYYFKDAGTGGIQWGAIYKLSDKSFISAFDVTPNTQFTSPDYDCYFRITITNAESCINVSDASKNGTFEPYATSSATITLGQAVYGGTVDFKTGVVTITDANIASYAGETLPSTWISDRDAYSSGGTPTTGAQVVYKLSTPTTLQLTPAELKLLQNTNNITTDGTTINLGYQQNNVVGELKADMESHIDMPWLQVLNSGQAIDFNDFLLLDDSGVTITFTLANLEVFKHRFLFVEIYRKQDDYDSYINASLLLNVATLYSAKNGYNSSFGMNGGITAVFNFIIKYEQGNYKIKMSINTNASSPLTDIYIRARLVD